MPHPSWRGNGDVTLTRPSRNTPSPSCSCSPSSSISSQFDSLVMQAWKTPGAHSCPEELIHYSCSQISIAALLHSLPVRVSLPYLVILWRTPFPGASLVAQWLRIACQCRGHGFEPWSRKISHAAEPLSPWATTTEAHVPQLLKPMRLEPVLRTKRSHHNEKPAHCNEE